MQGRLGWPAEGLEDALHHPLMDRADDSGMPDRDVEHRTGPQDDLVSVVQQLPGAGRLGRGWVRSPGPDGFRVETEPVEHPEQRRSGTDRP